MFTIRELPCGERKERECAQTQILWGSEHGERRVHIAAEERRRRIWHCHAKHSAISVRYPTRRGQNVMAKSRQNARSKAILTTPLKDSMNAGVCSRALERQGFRCLCVRVGSSGREVERSGPRCRCSVPELWETARHIGSDSVCRFVYIFCGECLVELT